MPALFVTISVLSMLACYAIGLVLTLPGHLLLGHGAILPMLAGLWWLRRRLGS